MCRFAEKVCRTRPATGCRDGTDPTLGFSGVAWMRVMGSCFSLLVLIPNWDLALIPMFHTLEP